MWPLLFILIQFQPCKHCWSSSLQRLFQILCSLNFPVAWNCWKAQLLLTSWPRDIARYSVFWTLQDTVYSLPERTGSFPTPPCPQQLQVPSKLQACHGAELPGILGSVLFLLNARGRCSVVATFHMESAQWNYGLSHLFQVHSSPQSKSGNLIGSSVIETLRFQCRGHRFSPSLGN